jgi:adenylosuccinate synthase
MSVEVVVGLQRGDEGKGRFVDMFAAEADIIARFNGGNNAGHTVVLPDDRSLALHLVPSGIAHKGKMNIIGNGALVDPIKLVEEIDNIRATGLEVSEKNLKVSSAAHLVFPQYIYDDVIREAGAGGQGTTKSGIAQTYAHKAMRDGARVEMIINDPEGLAELVRQGLVEQRPARVAIGLSPIDETAVAKDYVEQALKIKPLIADTVLYVNQELEKPTPSRVLAEGAQAFLLDIDHGMYPFTTSSSTVSGGVCTGLGIAPSYVSHVTGVAKAVQSHVGGGPFVTEITDPKLLQRLHGDMNTIDAEKGTTTGRVRRLGHLDLPQIRRAQMVNGEKGKQHMALTKLDWVPRYGKQVKICIAYRQDGKLCHIAPDAAYKLEQVKPEYKVLPTWDEDISEVRRFSDLPKNAQRYIEFIESSTGVPISMIGVGPRRDQVIVR